MSKLHKAMADIAPFGLRMQPDLKASIEAAAKANRRSMNAEIIHRLTNSGEAIGFRDWIAGQAIGSVIRQCAQDLPMLSAATAPEEYFAGKAYAIADAMLIARQSQEGEDA